MPRHARLDAPGTLHHIMARGMERAQIFRNDSDKEKFVTDLADLVDETKTRIPAWALVGNHFHLLLFSGPQGLPCFMRKLLTRYAVYFNRKYIRAGHLFQNRYKSVVCEEDPYFLQLVRYIHLNPLRAGMVKTLDALDSYPWSGHSALVGKRVREWQDRVRVLSAFSDDPPRAVRLYRAFMGESNENPDLDGGGLMRSLGPDRKIGPSAYDARVLGSSDFVLQMTESPPDKPSPVCAAEIVEKICRVRDVRSEHLRNGSRTKAAAGARQCIIEELVVGSGFPLSKVARLIGISPSAVANVLARGRKKATK
jgi:putative transposase